MARRETCASFYVRHARNVPMGGGVNMSNRLQFHHRPERKMHFELSAGARAAANLHDPVQQPGALLHTDQAESMAGGLSIWAFLLLDIEPAPVVGDRQRDLIRVQL